MKAESQRIALAEVEGWTDCFIIGFEAIGYPPNSAKWEEMDEEITPYYNSLDDIQRVFKGLTMEQKMQVEKAIMQRLVRETDEAVTALEVTPEIWREEILKATGRWTEGES